MFEMNTSVSVLKNSRYVDVIQKFDHVSKNDIMVAKATQGHIN